MIAHCALQRRRNTRGLGCADAARLRQLDKVRRTPVSAGSIDIDFAHGSGVLPRWLEDSGMEVREVRPLLEMARPGDYLWQWPNAFVEVGLQRLVELGRVQPAHHGLELARRRAPVSSRSRPVSSGSPNGSSTQKPIALAVPVTTR
mgnify:CR=1 FL=1